MYETALLNSFACDGRFAGRHTDSQGTEGRAPHGWQSESRV